MSRIIKFRAWDNINKQMIPHKNISILLKNVNNKPSGKQQMYYMQYTGIKTADGKEIYEGDEVKWWPHIPLGGKDRPAKQGIVFWDDAGFTVDKFYEASQDSPNCAFSEGMQFEIIGNIHQDSQLMEKP